VNSLKDKEKTMKPWGLVLLVMVFSVGHASAKTDHDCTGGPNCGREPGAVYSNPALTNELYQGGVCHSAATSNVPEASGLLPIEATILDFAQTSTDDPNHPEKLRQWWAEHMPYINCMSGYYNGFRGGSPVHLMVYRGFGENLARLMRKYEITPEMALFPCPETGMNLWEWMDHVIAGNVGFYDERKVEDIGEQKRRLQHRFRQLGYQGP
jgi:hypothetical protein